ncbi:glycine/betaine ABC transporter substrate-binding protein [Rhizobium sp. Root274]|uniref:choline ABC transporter substrate-binding protein n=1 Tax=unclassified Rhizobium TaxID=2613769 RepID=UPI00071346F7|nr:MULTISPECIES: choline ABC transporter substrate-binding protein [unclassified Rhizobium]KQW30016.1 glycine/betaine ABC transporter substrate-binding protein [Rhizobium sp. Root1240]KRD30660.1 glycine/betaine ABC transporter substrate-binding protein [Rhizobium sp. Root274]
MKSTTWKFVHVGLLTTLSAVASAQSVQAAEPEGCQTIRLAEPGWNDLAFTTGVGMTLLKHLGYDAKSSLLGIDVIYLSLKNKDLDVFLGYWDPAMITYAKPYIDEGTVETVTVNLKGAKYTFAVPAYVYEAGVRDFSDLQNFADQFDRKLYGIEPGSNQLMLDAQDDAALGLKGWEVVESSEQGMLAEVQRHEKEKDFIVFQGWAPHPMNTRFDMKYLTGGDKFYGPNFGAATVSTQVRKGYKQECPNVTKLLENLKFDVEFENKGMGYLMDDGLDPEAAAAKAIEEDPARLDAWLAGVTTFDGKPGLDAVRQGLGL